MKCLPVKSVQIIKNVLIIVKGEKMDITLAEVKDAVMGDYQPPKE
tara:strand:- start:3194 stop:3328 length:135 start_codon:yes stop_codon:yes gene_type:complete